MIRTDSNTFLLYIEPKKSGKLSVPINDHIVKFLKFAISESIPGVSNYLCIESKPCFKENIFYKGVLHTYCNSTSFRMDQNKISY